MATTLNIVAEAVNIENLIGILKIKIEFLETQKETEEMILEEIQAQQ